MNNCCDLESKISSIAKCEFGYFLSKANVVGVGVGFKVTNGFETCEKCIKVLVTSKVPAYTLNPNDLVPLNYRGIKTDVVQSGAFSICRLNKHIRPVLGGYSIGPATQPAGGSMGCVVTDNHSNFILSCNHVMAYNNKLPLGTAILQPAVVEGGKYPKDVVAALSEYVPLKPGTNLNITDCAIARIQNTKNVSPDIALIGKLSGVAEPVLGEKVEKAGLTTELTKGKVTTLSTTVSVMIDGLETTFWDQIITTKMSQRGDSGSVLVNYHNYAMGLLMTESPTTTVFNRFSTVLNHLNVLLVTG